MNICHQTIIIKMSFPMVRVCQELFPKGSYTKQREDGFRFDEMLKLQIDILLKNIIKDWDFTIIISGGGEVRVGKSVLAAQIGSYWTYMINTLYKNQIKKPVPFNCDNEVLEGKGLIRQGNYFGVNHPYACLIFDEAGADLEGRKIMSSMTQDVLDFYRECGQYNLFNILVLPEYFDLPKSIALSRSIFLIDVFYTADKEGNFERGHFNFYSRRNKKYLYLKGKKDLNYMAHPSDFRGEFMNFWTIDEKEYRKRKLDAMMKREVKRRNVFQMQRDACWYLLNQEFKQTQEKIAKRMEQLTGTFVAHNTVSDGIRHYFAENK